jgi:hypothetical protein
MIRPTPGVPEGAGVGAAALGLGRHQLPPPDLCFDPVEDVAAILPRLVDGADDAAEQPHELADLTATGLVLSITTTAALGEQ